MKIEQQWDRVPGMIVNFSSQLGQAGALYRYSASRSEVIAPGLVKTDIIVGEVEEVVSMAVFMVSGNASYYIVHTLWPSGPDVIF